MLLLGDANDDADVSGTQFWSNATLWQGWARCPSDSCPSQAGLNFIPVYRYVPDHNSQSESMTRTTPYYASDWGYVDFDGDSLPDAGLAMGRAPVSSATEAACFVSKTIHAAEMTESTTANQSVGLWTYGRNAEYGAGTTALEIADSLAAYFPSRVSLKRITSSDTGILYPSEMEAAGIAALDEGRSLVTLVSTVSNRYSWVFFNQSQYFSVSELESNPASLPFLLGASCSVADFDQTERVVPGCLGTPLGDQFIATEVGQTRGPWGYFGPSRGTWQHGDWLVAREFLRRVYDTGAESMGAAAAMSVRAVAQANPTFSRQAQSYVFIGDPAVQIPFARGVVDCNGNTANDLTDITAGTSLDVDCDGVPDECQAARVTPTQVALVASPDGSADAIHLSVRVGGVCGVNSDDPDLSVFAVRQEPHSDSVVVWSAVTATDPGGDTLRATSRSSVAGMWTISAAEISGCGPLALDVYAGGTLIARNVRLEVRSYDQDPTTRGVVDHCDMETFLQELAGSLTGACGDFDFSGGTNALDLAALSGHLGNHVTRELWAPNGGEYYPMGRAATVRWKPGGGDSSRVTLLLLRDSDPTYCDTIATDLPDDGSCVWLVRDSYPEDDDRTYRIEIVHTVGLGHGDNTCGTDQSDACFEIYRPVPVTVPHAQLPLRFALHQNQPNPFTHATTIRFDLPVQCRVELCLYDVQGRRVRTLVEGETTPGYQSVSWDGCNQAGGLVGPGVYFCHLRAGDYRANRKMVLLP